KISLSPQAERHDLKPFAVPLRPSQDELRQWELLPELPMWGDAADGRIVRMTAPSKQDGDVTPAEWLTEFLNYPAALVQFDTTPSSATRISHPIYRPPRPGYDVSSLEGPRGIHFADEYPLLVATTESLHALQDKIAEEIKEQQQPNARKPISGLDPLKWSALTGKGGDNLSNSLANSPSQQDSRRTESKPKVDMLRFRPNIVLRSKHQSKGLDEVSLPPFAEESWETIWFFPSGASEEAGSTDNKCTSELAQQQEPEDEQEHHGKLHLVARCARCPLTTVSPTTAERDPAIPLRLLARDGWRMRVKVTSAEGYKGDRDLDRRQPCFGMYACPVPLDCKDVGGEAEDGGEWGDGGLSAYGQVCVGDRVRVRWRREEKEG
ncbi:hypothetical protein CF319_g3567, partial [Tilletia indica]